MIEVKQPHVFEIHQTEDYKVNGLNPVQVGTELQVGTLQIWFEEQNVHFIGT